MKVLFVTDIHVNLRHLNSVLDEADWLGAEAIIFGGDLFPYDASVNPLELLHIQKAYARNEFLPAIAHWKKNHPRAFLYLDLGNDDFRSVRPVLEKADGRLFHLFHQRFLSLDDKMSLLGYQNVPVSPLKIKDWERVDHSGSVAPAGSRMEGFVSEGENIKPVTLDPDSNETIENDLSKMSARVRPPFIFISHSPPLGVLDLCANSTHAGSKAILDFIHEHQPILSLHGHIHEAPRTTGRFWLQVGPTTCVNPGQEEYLRFITFDTNCIQETLTLHQHGRACVRYPGIESQNG